MATNTKTRDGLITTVETVLSGMEETAENDGLSITYSSVVDTFATLIDRHVDPHAAVQAFLDEMNEGASDYKILEDARRFYEEVYESVSYAVR